MTDLIVVWIKATHIQMTVSMITMTLVTTIIFFSRFIYQGCSDYLCQLSDTWNYSVCPLTSLSVAHKMASTSVIWAVPWRMYCYITHWRLCPIHMTHSCGHNVHGGGEIFYVHSSAPVRRRLSCTVWVSRRPGWVAFLSVAHPDWWWRRSLTWLVLHDHTRFPLALCRTTCHGQCCQPCQRSGVRWVQVEWLGIMLCDSICKVK